MLVEKVTSDKMISFGIMQGRLTPSKGRGIQFFPFDNWKNEFTDCQKIGLDEIEWIFDYDRYNENPLWSKEGIKELNEIIKHSGVIVRSVCFDYFMRRPFYKSADSGYSVVRKENIEFVRRVLNAMKEVGASLLEIPMVDDSSLKTDDERQKVTEFLQDVLSFAKILDIKIGCETDMPVGSFRSFLDEVNDSDIYANYDSGNSSGLGYDHEAEIISLDRYIANVHIKDRVFHGTTVALGKGSADFDKVFSSLKRVGYNKSILLQAARDVDGDECNNIIRQMEFVKDYCKKYELV